MCPEDCTPEPIYFEFKLKMKNQAAAKQAVEKVRGLMDQVHEMGMSPVKFKFSSIGKNLIAGISLTIPKKSKLASFCIPDDIKDVFAQTNQHITAGLDINTSLKDLMESDDNLMQHLHGGFKMSLNMSVVSNIKDAVLELLVDDEEEQKW